MRQRRRGGAALLLASGLGCLIATGCGSKSTFQFDDLDLVPAQEELTEVSLGRFAIPIPIATDDSGDRLTRNNRVQFDFELYALVARDEQSQIADAWQRHQGKFRDRVIRACRNATLDDLQEPELVTLKGYLMDAVQAQLGDKEIRQLLITEVVSRQL